MKTEEQIKEAIDILKDRFINERDILSSTDIFIIASLIGALTWVVDGPDCTITYCILSGEPMKKIFPRN